MTEAEQIEAAKAALDKATPGPWEYDSDDGRIYTDGKWVGDVDNIGAETEQEVDANGTITAAAPALVRRVQELEDWQAKALPWLRGYKKFVSGERITHLSTLIEQAEVGSMAGLPGGFYG